MQTAVDAWSTRSVPIILQMVDSVYAAGCGEATWDEVLAKICRFGGLDGAALSTVGAVEPRALPLASFGLGSRTNPGALHDAMAADLRLGDSILRSTPGTVLRTRRIMTDPPTTPSRWTGSARVKGCIAWACVIVGRDGRRVICLEVHRRDVPPSGRYEPDDLLRQLAPHLVRAWRLATTSRPPRAMSIHATFSPRLEGVAPAADFPGLPEAARLRAEFGLTKAEARLALRLAEGSTLASAAQAFESS